MKTRRRKEKKKKKKKQKKKGRSHEKHVQKRYTFKRRRSKK